MMIALAAANFAVGMGAFMVIGLVTPVAGTFGLDTGTAGAIMTVYALVYAVMSPLLIAVTGAADRRRALLAGLALLAAGSLAGALAPGFATLLAARAVMAIGGGLVTPVAASIAVVSSAPERRGRALSIVFAGLTLAQVLGVPAGAFLAYGIGWQAAFVFTALLSVLALAAVAMRVPGGIIIPRPTLTGLASALVTPLNALAILFTLLLMSGAYVVYTYLAPLLEARHGLARDGISAVLLIYGCGAVAGNVVGGGLADRIGPTRTLLLLAAGQAALLCLVTLTTPPLWATVALVTAWGALSWAFVVPQQARLSLIDQQNAPLLLALNASAIYLGAAVGSAVGGAVLDGGADLALLGPVGGLFALLACLTLWLGRGRDRVR